MRRFTLYAFIGLSAIAAAAPAAEKLEQAKVTIAVGGRSLFYYLPLTLADRLGYFKDEGLTVEIADFPGGAKALQAMVGGSADVVSGAFEHVVDMHAKGIEVQEFVLQDRYSGIVLGLSKARATSYKSPKDLRGLKIGVTAPGSSTNIFVNALLARDGLPPDAVSIIGVGASSGAVAAMQKGQIDGISNLDPVITRLEKGGDIVAKVYNLSTDVARSAVKNLLSSHEKSGVRYWSGGEINLKAMNEMMRAQKIVGALKDDPDWSKIIDETFLPDDLKKKTN